MKRILFIVLVAIIVGGLLLAGCAKTATPSASPTTPKTTTPPTVADTGQTYNLKFSYHTPPQASMVGAYFTPWTAAVEQATGGRVKVTHYAGESLVKAKDQYDALTSGLSDIALVDPSETSGRFPQTEFDTLPYIFPDTTIGARVYWDILQKYCVNADFKDVKVLAVCVIAPSNYVGNKQAQNVADFKGMRVRTAGRTESWMIEALGGSPVEVATSELYSSLERGLLDSVFLSWSAVLSFGVKDVTKYRTECNLYYRAWPILINKKVWDSMPANIQKAIMDASGQENSANYCTANEKLAAGAKGAIAGSDKAAGKPAIYTLTAEQFASWKAASMPVWDKWSADLEAKKLPGNAIITDIKSLVQKYPPK